jgi:glc operon protein GlcG
MQRHTEEFGDASQAFNRLPISKCTVDLGVESVAETRRSGKHRYIADHAGELIAFARMDGARSFTIDLAMEKARAAAKLAIPTSALEASGRRSFNGNPWSAGGLPILHQGECAGGIGISGAKPEIDNDIAETVAALSGSPE